MKIGSKEHHEMMIQFEREFKKYGRGRLDREVKELWATGAVYQEGDVNSAFLMFRIGYAYGKVVADDY